jgi:hypothetical protein
MTDYELNEEDKLQRIGQEIESLKAEIFEHRINIVKWSSFDGDYSAQVNGAEQAISNAQAAIDALSAL